MNKVINLVWKYYGEKCVSSFFCQQLLICRYPLEDANDYKVVMEKVKSRCELRYEGQGSYFYCDTQKNLGGIQLELGKVA